MWKTGTGMPYSTRYSNMKVHHIIAMPTQEFVLITIRFGVLLCRDFLFGKMKAGRYQWYMYGTVLLPSHVRLYVYLKYILIRVRVEACVSLVLETP